MNQNYHKRDAKEIMKMIEKQKECNANNVHREPQISYEEACENYKFYKSRTLKANVEEADFKQNMAFREFYLSIKKRYDMQQRAHRFRVKQKKEIAKLKMVAQNKDMPQEEEAATPYLGKREAEPTQEEKYEEMQKKIRKLEKELQNKDKMCRELQERTESVAQFPQHVSVDKTCSQTQLQKMPQENDKLVDETESERDEDYGESMLVSSKPSRIQIDGECIPLKKQTSLTPMHQPNKTFEENGRELVIEIDNTSDRPVSQDDYTSANEQSQSAQSSSVQASEFVKTPKVQSLIRQIVNLKANHKKNNQYAPKVTEQQIEQKSKEIQIDQAGLSSRIKDMIDSSMIFAQLKKQPAKLLQRKNDLMEQSKSIQAQLEVLEENYQMTMNYIQSEETTQKMNQEQIQQLDQKIKKDLIQLRQMKEKYHQ